ncbi:hypothetical protein C8R44DRAFT_725004 [Mycena epipterygia]|nr:hypothetical protein C8R44DRAFT_725004 [Mycena epipterygia]
MWSSPQKKGSALHYAAMATHGPTTTVIVFGFGQLGRRHHLQQVGQEPHSWKTASVIILLLVPVAIHVHCNSSEPASEAESSSQVKSKTRDRPGYGSAIEVGDCCIMESRASGVYWQRCFESWEEKSGSAMPRASVLPRNWVADTCIS